MIRCLPRAAALSARPSPTSAGVIRSLVLLLTLLGSWFLMQTYFQHSWKAISLRSWLGEDRGLQRDPEGGGRGSIVSQPPEVGIAALTSSICNLWLRLQPPALATRAGWDNVVWWEAALEWVGPGMPATMGSNFRELSRCLNSCSWPGEEPAALQGV